MRLPASLKSCRTRPSPAIRSSLCRSTPQPRTTCRGFACSVFRRDRSKKNSKRCSSKANEETQTADDQAGDVGSLEADRLTDNGNHVTAFCLGDLHCFDRKGLTRERSPSLPDEVRFA